MADATLVDRLRRNLGATGEAMGAFSDAELALLLDQYDGDELAARVDGLWRLLTQAARLSDYTVGVSQERRAQVFDHLESLYAAANDELGRQRAADLAAFAQAGVTSVAVAVQSVF